MSAKKKQTHDTDRSAAEHYKLKTKAVDRLVNAKNAPEVSEAEIKKYTAKGKFHIPDPLKIVLLKFWFAGAVCYFILWGLGIYLHGLDLLVSLAIGLGVVTDLMLNKIIRFFEHEERANDKWIMITARQYWSIFPNAAYAGVLLFCVFRTYYALNILLGVDPNADPTTAEAMLGVEPLLFGALYMGFDLLFVKIKNTFISIINDAREKASGGSMSGSEAKVK